MEDKKEVKYITPDKYALLIRLAQNDSFLKLLEEYKGKKGYSSECVKAIKKFLHEEKIPAAWLEPIRNSIIKGQMDFPIESGIGLIVAGTELTDNTDSLLIVRDVNTGQISGDNTIKISISAKLTIDQIIQFLKRHKKEIEEYEEILELPEPPRNWKQINIALRIIRMKDEEKLTFSDIANELAKDKDLNIVDKFSDEGIVRKTYNRYKKYLHLK